MITKVDEELCERIANSITNKPQAWKESVFLGTTGLVGASNGVTVRKGGQVSLMVEGKRRDLFLKNSKNFSAVRAAINGWFAQRYDNTREEIIRRLGASQ